MSFYFQGKERKQSCFHPGSRPGERRLLRLHYGVLLLKLPHCMHESGRLLNRPVFFTLSRNTFFIFTGCVRCRRFPVTAAFFLFRFCCFLWQKDGKSAFSLTPLLPPFCRNSGSLHKVRIDMLLFPIEMHCLCRFQIFPLPDAGVSADRHCCLWR